MANVLVVDVANVMGSRPDGWWRDRAGAATRLLEELMGVIGQDVDGLGGFDGLGGLDGVGGPLRVHRVIAVVEGQARAALVPDRAASSGLEVMAAPADGDSSIVAAAQGVLAGKHVPIVVTADRGLRDRLPAGSMVAGPSWLLAVL